MSLTPPLQDSWVTVRIGDWDQAEPLVGGCKTHYASVAYFAFAYRGCDAYSNMWNTAGDVSVTEDYQAACDAQEC